MFVLFSVGLSVILEVIGIDILGTLVSLALIVPSLALGARRLHDTDKSGWWQLLWLIPIFGWIIIIIFSAQKTAPTDNQYGASAKPKVFGSDKVESAATSTPSAPIATGETVVPDAEVISDKTPR